MPKNRLLLFVALSFSHFAFAQDCDCKSNFEWVKKTFEENDAGFAYTLNQKGERAYEDLNKRTIEKIQLVNSLNECGSLLYEWLTFFRSGHISIRLNEQVNPLIISEKQKSELANWDTYLIDTDYFRNYLDNKKSVDFEGIWEMEPYTVGIKKERDNYIGFIIQSGVETWSPGRVKLKFSISDTSVSSVFYLRDHSAVNAEGVHLIGKNNLQIGNFSLVRKYPQYEDEIRYQQFFKSINASEPYIEMMNESTLYLRIPSFQISEKSKIDSILLANRDQILSTENLIIDIRNGTGGSDVSYEEVIPFIYTNPIRTIGVEYLSTKLNNQRMLDFIDKPEYGFDDTCKKWARKSFDKLDKKLGEFVNLSENTVHFTRYDTIYSYPKNVGIIINQGNGSTDEQFLLAAKQSRKVKLFGTTTHGVLDVSNMYYVPSPCNEFKLGYTLSRSMRIPDFVIDEKGIQPDYYLDKSIPFYDWINFVCEILNEK